MSVDIEVSSYLQYLSKLIPIKRSFTMDITAGTQSQAPVRPTTWGTAAPNRLRAVCKSVAINHSLSSAASGKCACMGTEYVTTRPGEARIDYRDIRYARMK